MEDGGWKIGKPEKGNRSEDEEKEESLPRLWEGQQSDLLGGHRPATWVGFANGNTAPGLEEFISMGVWQFAFGFVP